VGGVGTMLDSFALELQAQKQLSATQSASTGIRIAAALAACKVVAASEKPNST